MVDIMFRCVECGYGQIFNDNASAKLVCQSCGEVFFSSHGRPVFLKKDNQLFHVKDYLDLPCTDAVQKKLIPSIFYNFFSPSVNLSIDKILDELKIRLGQLSSPKVLVVGGGRQSKWLNDKLAFDDSVEILYSDIDTCAFVDVFCDGHDLPFFDKSFDAVITTAVLEHVLYPEKVASEIYRVLKSEGMIYSELPFMQQVHEGAYDFTRYTLSGHRRLFNGFSEISSGMVAGPATGLVWSIENFFLSFTHNHNSRRFLKFIVRLFFSWIKYFDFLLKGNDAAMDAASCTYFFGFKIEKKVSDLDIVSNYIGAKHLKHV